MNIFKLLESTSPRVSLGVADLITNKAAELNIPKSSLAGILLFNAVKNPDMFHLDFDMNVNAPITKAHVEFIYDIILTCRNGVGLDVLLVCQGDLEMTSDEIKSAINKLVADKRVQRIKYKSTRFEYDESYIAYQVCDKSPAEMTRIAKEKLRAEKIEQVRLTKRGFK